MDSAASTSSLPGVAVLLPRGTVREALDAYWRSKGMEPPSRENLAPLPPWPEEDAAAFEKVINDMFERIDENETVVPPITVEQLEAFYANFRKDKDQ